MPTITKITVVGSNTKSYTSTPQYRMHSFKAAEDEAHNIAILDAKIARLISYLNQYPDTEIQYAVNVIFGPATLAEKKKKGKNKYQYIGRSS